MAAMHRFAALEITASLVLALAWAAPVRALDPSKALTQYGHEVWLTDQGLPQNSVQALVQSRDGYIWIGTQEGLVRFDGVKFTVFDKVSAPALRSNYVNALAEGPDGALWVGTDGGGVYKFKGGVFSHIGRQEGLSSDRVQCILVEGKETAWIGTDGGGLVRYEAGKVTVYDKSKGLPGAGVWCLCRDGSGTLWAGTSRGLVRMRGESFSTLTVKDGLCDDIVAAILEDRRGRLWVGTYRGLNCLAEGKWSSYTVEEGLSNNNVLSLFEDPQGCLWVGTYGGLNRLKNGRFEAYTTKEGLSNDSVWTLKGDVEGSLWIGTLGGLNRFWDTKFSSFGAKEGLPSDVVLAVMEARDGSIWMGTEGGGACRLKDGRLTTFGPGGPLGGGMVMALCEDAEGAIWLGTEGSGLARFKGGKIERAMPKGAPKRLLESSVSCILQGRDGTLWVGAASWLLRVKDGIFTYFSTKEGLSSGLVNCLLEARDGSLWIGTDGGGLNRLKDGKFTALRAKDGLPDEQILSLYEDSDGTLWIGSNNGLCRLKDGKLMTITVRDGLFDDKAFAILEDASGNLWISCNKGVYRVSRTELNGFADGVLKSVRCTAYGRADGLRSSECNGATQPAGWKGRDGRLYFATMKGFGMIDPSHIKINPKAPPVVIEKVQVDNDLLPAAERARIAPGNHRIEFGYTGLSLIAPDRIRFKVRLEGLEEEWVDVGGRREAFYTGIPPGAYTFRVIACNSDGVWNEAGASYAFELKPRFYQSRWFFVLLAAILVLAGASLQRLRVRRLKLRQGQLEKLVDAQTAELAKANTTLQERGRQLEKVNLDLTQRGVQLEQLNEELQRISNVDPLTGIGNRRYFSEIFDVEWRRAKRTGAPLSLIMADIDHFKPFNDRYGHQAGDDCLQRVAVSLQGGLHRAGDLVARYGGEEFVVLLPAHDELSARTVALRLREGVERKAIPTEVSSICAVVTVSLGAATAIPAQGGSPEGLLSAADAALYAAKQGGRNKVVAAQDPPEKGIA